MKKQDKLPVSALILAGGKGKRAGGNKLFLSLDGAFLVEPLIEKMSFIFDEVLLCAAHGESEAVHNAFQSLIKFYSVKITEDRSPERGPIEGLYTGLKAMVNKWGFLLGCDMPTPQEAVIRYMWSRTSGKSEEYKITAARLDGHLMPLHAFYHRDCASCVHSSIEQAECERDAAEDESELSRKKQRSGCNSKLNLKSFYDRTKVNIINENELSTIPGWRRSFAGYNTGKELESLFSYKELG